MGGFENSERDNFLRNPATPAKDRGASPVFFAQARAAPVIAGLADEPSLENQDSLIQFREKVFTILSQAHLIRMIGEGDNRVIVCDIEAMRGFKYSNLKFKDKLSTANFKDKFGDGAIVPTLFHAFKDTLVYSEKDYAQILTGAEIDPKPLFYIPRDSTAALEQEAIQKSDFYLGFWQILSGQGLGTHYPTQKDGLASDLASADAITACLVFHPKFGNGFRDGNNRLIVTFPDGSRRPVSSRFFKEQHFTGAGGDREINLIGNPSEFMVFKAKGLTSRGLLTPDDFKRQAGYRTSEQFGMGFRPLNLKGLVMIDGVRYTFGTEFKGPEHAVFKLSNSYGAIIRNTEDGPRLVRIFELNSFDRNDQDAFTMYSGANEKLYPIVRKGKFRSYTPQEFASISPAQESMVTNFNSFLSLVKLTSERGINISRFSMTEQALSIKALERYGGESVVHLLNNYGINGLRTLMACEGALGNADFVFDILQKIDRPTGLRFTKEVGLVFKLVTEKTELNPSRAGQQVIEYRDDVKRAILQQAGRLLLSSLPIVNGQEQDFDLIDVGRALAEFRERVALMYQNAGDQSGEYQQLLTDLAKSSGDPRSQTLILTAIQRSWIDQTRRERASPDGLSNLLTLERQAFYAENEGLFRTASETTADTETELARLNVYLQSIYGRVLDGGCGPGERITVPMAKMLEGRGIVYGVDLITPTAAGGENLVFSQDDLTHLNFPESFFDHVTLNWSIPSDQPLRQDQILLYAQAARVLRKGGKIRMDVPHLEGEGGYLKQAQTYQIEHASDDQPPLFGMIEQEINDRKKHFYITPEDEYIAMLKASGFGDIQIEHWRTKAGKPRSTIIATLEEKISPFAII